VVIPTFQALLVAILAILPGASLTFAYERQVERFGAAKSPDRLVRLLAASAMFQALYSGPELLLYQKFVVTNRIQQGQLNPILFEFVVLAYLLLPYGFGSLLGYGREKGWRWAVVIMGEGIKPRAWDRLWRRDTTAIVRLKLKSDVWVAGLWGEWASSTVTNRRSYAAGYPEDGDLYLSVGFEIDAQTGEVVRNSDEQPMPVLGERGLLVRWAEVEYLDFQEL
jgi:Family of unknown function (DUF6338)